MSISKYMKVVVWVMAVLALVVLTGCTTNGGGVVALTEVTTGLGAGVPGDASVALTINCNDARNMVSSVLHWTDTNNGANFTARQPWIPITDFDFNTCEEAAALRDQFGLSVLLGIINSQGQESGSVDLIVSAPGQVPAVCGDLQRISIRAFSIGGPLPGNIYRAAGCLDHGRILFH
jgi:hypothetical protein